MHTHILKRPIVTERSLALANQVNTFTFEVSTTSSKNQVKTLIEELYGVKVVRVRTIVVQPQQRKTGKRRLGRMTARSKKALVTLKQGQTLEIFDVGGQE